MLLVRSQHTHYSRKTVSTVLQILWGCFSSSFGSGDVGTAKGLNGHECHGTSSSCLAIGLLPVEAHLWPWLCPPHCSLGLASWKEFTANKAAFQRHPSPGTAHEPGERVLVVTGCEALFKNSATSPRWSHSDPVIPEQQLCPETLNEFHAQETQSKSAIVADSMKLVRFPVACEQLLQKGRKC